MNRIGGKNRLVLGTNNAISDISGQKHKVKDMRLTWDNKLVHWSEWYAKSPQLIIRPRQENIAVKITRTQNVPTELADPPITPSQYL